MTQLNLLDPPYQKTSETSKAAAEEIVPSAQTLRMKVLRFLQDHGPATDEQIQDALNMPGSTERPRRVELQKMGLVFDTGLKNKTRSGRCATLWRSE